MKILMNSLGCDKNLVDAEEMLSALAKEGYSFTDDLSEAEIVIINTCCFIEDAKQESIDAILEAAQYKKEGNVRAIIASGCMAARYAKEIREALPEVDVILGIAGADAITKKVREIAKTTGHVPFGSPDCRSIEKSGQGVLQHDAAESEKSAASQTSAETKILEMEENVSVIPAQMHTKPRTITTGGLFEYLRIADGCDKYCTYCVIPSIRGHYRSVPMEELITQAEELAEQGVKELILIAQETTLYGTDLYGEKRLHILLEKLCRIEGIRWIRLMYCYPEEIYPALIDVMAREEKICKYIDMPIQHINDAVLKKMNRRTTGADIRGVIRQLREAMPSIAIRTTLLTGFPGETEEAHEELLAFVKETGFERLGVFCYSKEEDTPAAKMKPQVPKKVKARRRAELMAAQQAVSAAFGESRIGHTEPVLMEGELPEEGVYVGRTYADAPEIDGYIFVASETLLKTGDLILVRITGASEYDLKGEAL